MASILASPRPVAAVTGTPGRRRVAASSNPRSTARVVWFGATALGNGVLACFALDRGDAAARAVDASLLMFCVGVGCRHDRLVHVAFVAGRLVRSYRIHQLTYHLGQLHRATALAGSAWLAVGVAIAASAGDPVGRSIGVVVLGLLVAMAVTAHDAVRHRRHERFEAVHRYGGWVALALVGVLVGRRAIAAAEPSATVLAVLTQPAVVLLTVLVALVVEPWLGLRRLPVEMVDVTDEVVIVALPGRRSRGQFVRVSRDGKEWHSFAVATTGRQDPKRFCLVIRRAGDWTDRLARDAEQGRAPTHLLVRRARGHGFMCHARAYDKVLFVATGAGIGPILPYLVDGRSIDFECLWIGRHHRQSMGDELVQRVLASGRVTLLDSSTGRPAVGTLVADAAPRFEAVFVVGSAAVRDEVARACQHLGMPWYGPTFDS